MADSERLHLFDDYVLDTARGCLLRAGRPVHLRPQAYRALKYLAEHRGRLVTKDQLIEEVWEGRAVTDDSLVQCLRDVRRALGEGGDLHLRTERGRGYVLDSEAGGPGAGHALPAQSEQVDVVRVVVEEVEETDEAEGAGQTAARAALPGVARPAAGGGRLLNALGRHRAVALAALAAAVALAAAGSVYFKRPDPREQPIRSVAVLPFANGSGNPELDYLSDGLSESLIDRLSQMSGVKVIARSSSFRYRGQEGDPQGVARSLGVEALVTGRVAQRGDELQVRAELVDARAGTQLWGEQYSRRAADVQAVQEEIARRVSEKLRLRLSGVDGGKPAKGYTADTEAYQLYLKGRYHHYKLTVPGVRKGIDYYRQAIDADPTYALPYVGMADAYRSLSITGVISSREGFPQSKAAALRALEIDPDLAEAHTVLGWVGFMFDWDWGAAEGRLRRAIELNPNSPDARRAYAHLLSNLGRHEEALAEVKRARELDPLSLFTNGLEGQFLFYAGRDDEAISRYQKTLELDPNYWVAHNNLGRVYLRRGSFQEAIAEFSKAKELSSGSTEPVTQLGYALAKAGRRELARATLEELRTLSAHQYVPAYNYAMVHNGLGETEEALRYLERSFQEREVQLTFMKVDTRWDELRADPRFQALLRGVGLAP